MPLVYYLFRCPRCGHDPLEGAGDEASCPACGVRFARGRGGGRIAVLEPGGGRWEVPSSRLTEAVDALGGAETRARGPGGELDYAAPVLVRRAREEEPVPFRGEILGFVEVLGEAVPGRLQITGEALNLWPQAEASTHPRREAGSEVGRGPPLDRWDLLDIQAVQTSSSSLQIAPRGGGLVHFTFRGDSPRRWEELLHRALREAWRRAGRGEIAEFQPRIRAR